MPHDGRIMTTAMAIRHRGKSKNQDENIFFEFFKYITIGLVREKIYVLCIKITDNIKGICTWAKKHLKVLYYLKYFNPFHIENFNGQSC